MKNGLTYTINKASKLVIKEHFGQVTLEDEIELLTSLFSDPEFEEGMSVMCDLGHAEIDWGLREMDQFRSFLTRNAGKAETSKWAVVSSGGATQHNARIFIKLNDSIGGRINMRLFSTREEALRWLSGRTVDTPLSK